MADSYWSNPRDALFKPMPGFVVGGAYRGAIPSYGGVSPVKLPRLSAVQSPTEWPQLPYPVVGMDTGTGQRDVDLNQPTSAIPDTGNIFEQLLKFKQASYPIERQQQEDAARMSARLAQEQMLETYPILQQAAEFRSESELARAKRMRDFIESRPSAIQAQLLSQATTRATELGALAAASQALRGMGFSGNNISYNT